MESKPFRNFYTEYITYVYIRLPVRLLRRVHTEENEPIFVNFLEMWKFYTCSRQIGFLAPWNILEM